MLGKTRKPRAASIQWRLVFIYVLVIVVVMQAVSIYLVADIQKMLELSFEKGLERTASLLAGKLEDKIEDEEYFKIIIQDELKYQRPSEDTSEYGYNILLFSSDFKKLHGSGGPDDYEFWVDEVLLNAAENSYFSSIKKDATLQRRYQNSCLRIDGEDGTQGYIYIVADMEQQVYSKVSDIRSTLLMGTGITLIIAMILSLALARTITRPIKELTLSAAEIARGNFSQQIEVHSGDEIGQLGEMFNSMAGRLSQTLGEISNEKSKMDAIFTYMSNGVIAFDITGELIHINPRAKELLVLPDKEETQLVDEIIEKLEIEDIAQTVSLNRLLIREVALPYDGGRIIRVQQAPFKREQQHNGIIMVLEDITEQQKLDRMRREFIANVSHELKTPLTNIQIRIQTLQEYLTEKNMTATQLIHAVQAGWKMLNIEPDKIKSLMPAEAADEYDLTYQQLINIYQWQVECIQQKMLPVIVSETTRMNKLVRDLLQLSQLDSEYVELNKRRVSLSNLLSQVVERMMTTAKEKGTIINYQSASNVGDVLADSDAIEQVAANVLSNAIKYSPTNSEINVELGVEGAFAVVNIIDNGIGIPAEDLTRIFERFYRVDKARSRQLGGTGLGLAIAKQMIEAHGGKIDIFSTVGKGTEVRFTVPLLEVED